MIDAPTTPAPSYGFAVTLPLTVESAVAAVTAALKAEGFGVLTTIDVRATLKTKLDVDYPPYVILGACNPPLAHRALTAEPAIGLLLPCNVVVRAVPGGAEVLIADPRAMLAIAASPALEELAREARARLERVIAGLGAKGGDR
jgi:uncharacterized protein (DUF302 family)